LLRFFFRVAVEARFEKGTNERKGRSPDAASATPGIG
jgi:hypothetical protein